jgi:hypothetical protein
VENRVRFLPGGQMTIEVDPNGPTVDGTWYTRDGWMCVNFAPRGEECWPYQRVLLANQPVEVTSNRGQDLVITLMN